MWATEKLSLKIDLTRTFFSSLAVHSNRHM